MLLKAEVCVQVLEMNGAKNEYKTFHIQYIFIVSQENECRCIL